LREEDGDLSIGVPDEVSEHHRGPLPVIETCEETPDAFTGEAGKRKIIDRWLE